jgi:hypothetical protein
MTKSKKIRPFAERATASSKIDIARRALVHSLVNSNDNDVCQVVETCWELDAMPANVLRERVESEIRNRIDQDAWDACEIVQEAERESMNSVLRQWKDLRAN